MTDVDRFVQVRPYYTREHVTEIETYMAAAGVPFCPVCADWHEADETHTSD